MTYKDCIASSMTWLGEQPDTCVIGYNTTPPGGSGGGSFNGFPIERRHEMPLAEALMTGVSIGMSLDGWIPVLWLERMDFILHAADQIVNHLDKLKRLSNGIHQPAVIIRVCVGNRYNPLFTGPAHIQNLSKAFREMISFPVVELKWCRSIQHSYMTAYQAAKLGSSTMLVEFKDQYNE